MKKLEQLRLEVDAHRRKSQGLVLPRSFHTKGNLVADLHLSAARQKVDKQQTGTPAIACATCKPPFPPAASRWEAHFALSICPWPLLLLCCVTGKFMKSFRRMMQEDSQLQASLHENGGIGGVFLLWRDLLCQQAACATSHLTACLPHIPWNAVSNSMPFEELISSYMAGRERRYSALALGFSRHARLVQVALVQVHLL
jgi:hypothetical protein